MKLSTRPQIQHPTCPYCKDTLRGELDLVTCGRCTTLHHAACFKELGRCTALGCQGKRPFPVLRREEGVVEPLTLDFTPCDLCGATESCTQDECASSLHERRQYARHQAYERKRTRREQRRPGDIRGYRRF